MVFTEEWKQTFTKVAEVAVASTRDQKLALALLQNPKQALEENGVKIPDAGQEVEIEIDTRPGSVWALEQAIGSKQKLTFVIPLGAMYQTILDTEGQLDDVVVACFG